MSLTHEQIRNNALLVSTLVGVYLSYENLGGLLVFGGRARGFGGFCLIYAPELILPVTLVAWWKPRVGLALWALVVLLHFGDLLRLAWPKLGAMASHTLLLFWPFLIVGLLLAIAVYFDSRKQVSKPL